MGGPIVRTGTTPEFWANWDQVFGDNGKKTTAKKKSAKKSAAKAGKKKSAKKSAKRVAKKK